MRIDLTKIESNTWKPGEYPVTCTKAELKDTQNMGQMIKAEFTLTNGRKLWHNFNIVNQSEKAQEIGLGQLKTFLEVSGFTKPELTDVNDMLNLRCNVRVKIEESDTYGEQPRITTFKPHGALIKADPIIGQPTVPGNIF